MLAQIDVHNYKLVCVTDYSDGVDVFLTQKFEVAFIGYKLGERNGLDFIREISEINVHIPLIFVSDIESKLLDIDVINAGASDFISRKNMTPVLLERSIRYALNRKHTEQNLRESKDELTRHMIDLRDSRERTEAQTIEYLNMAEELAIAKDEIEEALNLAKKNERLLAENSPVGIWQLSVDGYTIYMNASFRQLFEIDGLEDIRGVTCDQLVLPSFKQAMQNAQQNWNKGNMYEIEVQATSRKTGTLRYLVISGVPINSAGGIAQNILATVVDNTSRKEVEKNIRHMAQHDTLTGLPNRALFFDRLEVAISNAKRAGEFVGVFFLDLDHFKDINDTLGHDFGDMLLQEAAQRIRDCARDTDTVARLGGDEFAIISTFLSNVQDAHHLANRILKALSRPFHIQGQEIHTGGSIGISIYPNDANEPNRLLKFSDIALYEAKGTERGTYQFFDQQMDKEVQQRRAIEQELRSAIEMMKLDVHYQPQIDLNSGKVIGAEALLRWKHEDRGWIAPSLFIPIAEGGGLIGVLGEWVLQTACEQVRNWQDQGWDNAKVAVNVSAAQLKDQNFVQSVCNTLDDKRVRAEWLELEITESMIMERMEETLKILNALNDLKVTLSMDDFGTGFSSFAYLKKLLVGKLKIDKSFIQDIPENHDDCMIAKTIIDIGRNLNMKVIAEGVEEDEQGKFLLKNGCHSAQGYFYGKPVPAHEFDFTCVIPVNVPEPESP